MIGHLGMRAGEPHVADDGMFTGPASACSVTQEGDSREPQAAERSVLRIHL